MPHNTHTTKLTKIDHQIGLIDHALRTLFATPKARRPMPVPPKTAEQFVMHDVTLTNEEKIQSGQLMRINHVGEVCAQALYIAQAANTKDTAIRQHLLQAAAEENDHLAWTHQRLKELGTHPSWLNPLWYAGAFALGWAAGSLGTAVGLGFVRETEAQVEKHLAEHLAQLSVHDHASKAVVAQMQAEEALHGQQAKQAGGMQLPSPIQAAMRASAKIMTCTAKYI